MDDVINVSGHRLGTAEVEDVLAEHPVVAEAAVVGYPHEVKGTEPYTFTLYLFYERARSASLVRGSHFTSVSFRI